MSTLGSIYTAIINGDVPARVVHRDERCVAILTVNPTTPGHCLVIPVEPVSQWWLLDDDVATHLLLVAKKVAGALHELHEDPPRIAMVASGFEIDHVHLHVFAANSPSDLDLPGATEDVAEASDLDDWQQRITAVLG